jgi:hypothetical protein
MKWSACLRAMVLVLFVLTVVTMPLAASKYVTINNGVATARVAKWMHTYTANPTNGAYAFSWTNIGAGQAKVTFTIRNDSEVFATYKPRINYIDATGTTDVGNTNVVYNSTQLAGVTYACTIGGAAQTAIATDTFLVKPAEVAAFTATMPAGSTNPNMTYRCRIYVDAVQVD